MNKEYYTSVTQNFGKILYRGYKIDSSGNRKRVHGKLDFKPSLFLENNSTDSEFKSMFGKPLKEKKFDSMAEARAFIKEYQDILEVYGYQASSFQYQFIAGAFPVPLEISIDSIEVQSIDIETKTEKGGFPNPRTAQEEITLITVQDKKTKVFKTFGTLVVDTIENYNFYKSESELLEAYINFVRSSDPDIIVGWNSSGFDIPYIINRIVNVLGQEFADRLSPFGKIECKEESVHGKQTQKFTIVGRMCLDLLELYKKYTFVKREKYSLDHVAEIELSIKKLENPYDTFREFYEKSPTLFVQYNIRDTELVTKLDEKLGLLQLALSIAYLTKSNYDDVFGPVKLWTNYILSTLMNENTYFSVKRESHSSDGFIGAYVHDPVPGAYDWIVTTDAASLYPNIAIGLNMSPETIVDVIETDEAGFLSGKYDFSGTEYAVAVNGTRFSREKEGVLPRLLKMVGDGRNIAKKKMLSAKSRKELIIEELKKRGVEI